jgi:hypothetical protein
VLDHRAGRFHAWLHSSALTPYRMQLDAPFEVLDKHRFVFLAAASRTPLPDDDAPYYWHVPAGDGRTPYLRFLRQHVWPGTSRVCADVLTLPDAPEQAGLSGLEHPHNRQARAAAWHALELLGKHAQQRRGGRRVRPVEVNRARLWDAAQRTGLIPERITEGELNFQLKYKATRPPYVSVSRLIKAANFRDLTDFLIWYEAHPSGPN